MKFPLLGIALSFLLLSGCASRPQPKYVSCNSVTIPPPPGNVSLRPFKPAAK